MAALLPVGMSRALRRSRQPSTFIAPADSRDILLAPGFSGYLASNTAANLVADFGKYGSVSAWSHDGAATVTEAAAGIGAFGSGPFSVTVLMRTRSGFSGGTIVGNNKSGVAGGWLISASGSSVVVNTAGSFASSLTATLTVIDDTPHVLTLTRSAAGVYRWYVDGVADTTATVSVYDVDTGFNTAIAAQRSGAGFAAFAKIDVPLVGFARRDYSPAEVPKIHSDLWRLFMPEQRPRLISLPIGPFVYARPTSDVGAGAWTTAPLYDKVDEVTASDADEITAASAGSVAELALGDVTDPGVDTLHSIKLRASGSGSLQVDLVQGSGNLLTVRKTRTRPQQPAGAPTINSAFAGDLLYLYAPWIRAGGRHSGKVGDYAAGGAQGGVRFGERVGLFTGYGGASENLRIDIHYSYTFPRGLTFIFRGKCDAPWDGGWNLFDRGTSGAGNGSYGVMLGRASGVRTMSAAQRVSSVDNTGVTMYVNGKSAGTSRTHNQDEVINLVVPFQPPDGQGFYDTKFCVGPTSETSLLAVLDRALTPAQSIVLSEDVRQLIAALSWPQHIPAAKPIASRTIPLVATPTDYRRELLPAEAALITDYSDLRVRFTGV